MTERETHSRLPSQLSPSSIKSHNTQELEINVEPLVLDQLTEATRMCCGTFANLEHEHSYVPSVLCI